MNVMDGIEAAAIIQDKKPTPIVFLTAYESTDIVKQAGKVGASAYLTKPPNGLDIERALLISLARHNDIMELRKLNVTLIKQTAERHQAMDEINSLRTIVPICSYCKKIRDDKGIGTVSRAIYTTTQKPI